MFNNETVDPQEDISKTDRGCCARHVIFGRRPQLSIAQQTIPRLAASYR